MMPNTKRAPKAVGGGNPARTGGKAGTPSGKAEGKDQPALAAVTPAAPAAQAAAPARTFPIAGLGASAGGLQALEEFFKQMPPDSGMAFVVVTHQHPGHPSLLPELLRKCAAMPVAEASDNLRVQPNCIYVARPEGCLAMLNGTLQLMDCSESAAGRLPIDYFLRSLAEDQRERAVGIILSGTASDGTLGVKAIKGVAGLTMAQQPESAEYPDMPRNAIATGLVDCVLPAGQLPERLLAYTRGSHLAPLGSDAAAEATLPEPLLKLIVLLRNRTGHDFSGYKPTAIRRRIERRMNLHQVKGPQEYVRVLQENPHELDLLFKELLIGVTSFFRDPEAFEALGKTALPELLEARPDNAVVRVWVPACATGEEAYSLAILLREGAERVKKRFTFQVFGTDLDSQRIAHARTGVYPKGIAVDVPRERRERFFIEEDGHYRLNKEIRELVIFAPQNVCQDPPFTKLDLISCRNLLIYLNGATQRRLLSLFHYALKPDGLLFLGSSESIGELRDHFEVVDPKAKIFRCTGGAWAPPAPSEFSPGAASAPPPAPRLSAVFDRLLLGRFAPASVIVNERGDISFIHGRTGLYLEPASGHPRLNVLEMARAGLRLALAVALRRAARQKSEVLSAGVRVQTDGSFTLVDVAVSRITEPESIRGLFLVTFRPARVATAQVATGRAAPRKKPPAASPPPGRMDEVEEELLFTRESLQNTVEELQTTNEEVEASNEELQSTNEELQSANEELETSKEEMQSLNEELQTVNAQLQSKMETFALANDDLQNLLNSTTISTVFLDSHLHIRRFTEEARKVFNLIPTDVGRPIADLASHLNYDQLVADATEVLRTLVAREKEVPTRDGGWLLVRILPYRTTENVIDGLVITLVDITRPKRAEQAAEQSRAYAESIVATVRGPLVVLDPDLRVVSANRAFYRQFKVSAEQTERRLIYEVGNGQWNLPQLRHLLEKVLSRRSRFEDFEVEHDFPGVGRRVMLLNARRLEQPSTQRGRILLAMEDVTQSRGPLRGARARPAVQK